MAPLEEIPQCSEAVCMIVPGDSETNIILSELKGTGKHGAINNGNGEAWLNDNCSIPFHVASSKGKALEVTSKVQKQEPVTTVQAVNRLTK